MSGKNHGGKATRTIKVDYLARVEGEGAMSLKIRNSTLEDVQLRIFEPPRFFEGLLRGRAFTEAPDITSRICGICPIAYQMSAIHAMENACDVSIEGSLRELRRLFYCGEWISSHTLHIYMLHGPDFLGYPSAVEMARDHPQIVEKGLELKKTGNEIMTLMGGREIHPVSARVGGFTGSRCAANFRPCGKSYCARGSWRWVRWNGPRPLISRNLNGITLLFPCAMPTNTR